MVSTADLERLIAEKRREIEMEKIALGLTPPSAENIHVEDVENNEQGTPKTRKRVTISDSKASSHAANLQEKKIEDSEDISAGLERYIRRYLGLPVMLKAGEFSPNNPILRGERTSGDVLLGLGEYERRRNTLRRIRQQQYREYLDQQAKKKQEEKEIAEKLRREQEERERKRDEEREKLRKELEQDRASPEQRRASVCYVSNVDKAPSLNSHKSKVDTACQVGITKPLSVAVQTDDTELYGLSRSPPKCLTTAERELSPRTVTDTRPEWDQNRDHWDQRDEPLAPRTSPPQAFDEHALTPTRQSNREKLMGDLRHTYMPSILDADAIRIRNIQAEKEAAERKQFYQQELKNQILEQQRIREERKTREKMLEQAEMRRLEEQLRMLRTAQETEIGRHHDITATIRDSASKYDTQRNGLQRDIDHELKKLRARTHPARRSSDIDTLHTISKLPFYYPTQDSNCNRKPYSTNIPENSIFSPTYDVDSYLRKNLNPSKEVLLSNRLDTVSSEGNFAYDLELRGVNEDKIDKGVDIDRIGESNDKADSVEMGIGSGDFNRKVVTEKALIHDRPKEKRTEKPTYEPSIPKKQVENETHDDTPIPVLRHSPKVQIEEANEDLSEKMRQVDDKWKVPAVQKNILKSLPTSEKGKNLNILTQLGSMRRMLQLEQMRLDNLKSSSK